MKETNREKSLRKPEKGQSSIEYLTTYGWMLLVVVIAGSTVFSMVSSDCKMKVNTGTFGSLSISKMGITQDSFSVVFRNSESETVEIKSVKIEGSKNNKGLELSVGEEKKYSVTEVNRIKGCQKHTMTVVYDIGNLNNMKKDFTLKAPFEVIKQIVKQLLASGDEIQKIETKEAVLPTNNTTMCFGDKCPKSDGENLTGTEKYLNISGDSMQGTLKTDAVDADCYGDLCNTTKTSETGYVGTKNNTMNGSLNITEIKPIQSLCLGGTCVS